jgi:hypothetical protein
MLLRFQRKHLVETSTSSQDSDPPCKYDTIRLMHSKNPLIRLSIFGRLKKMIMTYKEAEELGETDRVTQGGTSVHNNNNIGGGNQTFESESAAPPSQSAQKQEQSIEMQEM